MDALHPFTSAVAAKKKHADAAFTVGLLVDLRTSYKCFSSKDCPIRCLPTIASIRLTLEALEYGTL